jgi:hypothetical protein
VELPPSRRAPRADDLANEIDAYAAPGAIGRRDFEQSTAFVARECETTLK